MMKIFPSFVNRNESTGIYYGVISVNNLDPDLLDDLFYGPHTVNESEQYRIDEFKKEIRWELESDCERDYSDEEIEEIIEDRLQDALNSGYFDCSGDDDIISGEYTGVRYQISWLGGAPLLWVFESAVIGQYPACSPCCPNAGNLDSEAGEWSNIVECYDVPSDWRKKDDCS